jgi:diguanylate cyclase (GGDEF)-like protein/PAS domain S-box-containing protein
MNPLAEPRGALYRDVFDCFADGIFVTDARRRMVALNPAFTSITGYAAAEMLGARPRFLLSGGSGAAQYRAMWRECAVVGRWEGEWWIATRAGVPRALWLSVCALDDPGAAPRNYVAVLSDRSERKAAEDRIAFLAQHDPLTGLPNRHLLDDRLSHALASAQRHGDRVALLFLDLDRFKVINDSLGHRIGDLLLCSVAARLKSLIREEDTVARLGGDEFVFVIAHIDRPEMPAHVAQKIIWALAEAHAIEGEQLSIGASVGISVYPDDAGDGEKLIRNADTAMYRAKARGGCGYEFYTANMTHRALARMSIETKLRHAREQHELIVFYQPKVDLASGRIVGAEALLRWSHPELGVVPPVKFIPVAEETGLIVEIGAWVLASACLQNKRWQQQGLAPIPVSVNVSGRQCEPELVGTVERALAASQLEARFLDLELTESTLMADIGPMLRQLKAMGLLFSIDDFGTGYSSLSYLKHFPFDTLKIDKSFIADIAVGDRSTALAGAAIALAHSLNLKATAEGVSAAWQARYLREHGCDSVQGYFFGRPLPATKFAAALRRGISIPFGPGYQHAAAAGAEARR